MQEEHFSSAKMQPPVLSNALQPAIMITKGPSCVETPKSAPSLLRKYVQVGENSSVGNPGSLDFADVFGGEDTPQSITLTLSTGPIELAREQLEKLTWSEHVAIWKVCCYASYSAQACLDPC